MEVVAKDSSAKMKTFSADEEQKIGCKRFLEVTVPINHNAEQTVKYFMEKVREIRFAEAAGEQKERVEEAQVASENQMPQEISNVVVPEELK